ncbi:MAG TPA: hypothetical protein EYN66_01435 [Myxococcales bacterium]|nr:hypothetical protein [Myxococcales bacterium]
MAEYTEKQIAQIVERVVGKLAGEGALPKGSSSPSVFVPQFNAGDGVFGDADAAVKAARQAYLEVQDTPLEVRKKAVQAMREVGRRLAPELSRMAVEETGP